MPETIMEIPTAFKIAVENGYNYIALLLLESSEVKDNDIISGCKRCKRIKILDVKIRIKYICTNYKKSLS